MPRKKTKPVPSNPELKEYLCEGTLSLTGVQFTIVAESLEEAQQMARDGQWTDYDTLGAASSDWDLNGKVEENS